MDRPVSKPLGVERSAALADGIYAVAMTLLVIDLRLPEGAPADLLPVLTELLPRFETWAISFFVLALFWFGQNRAFHQLRHVDGRLVALNIVQLACVSLMPFCCALLGRYGTPLAQAVYSLDMALLGLLSLAIAHYIRRHPELREQAVEPADFRGMQLRILGLIAISVAAVPLSLVLGGSANWLFLLMALIMPLSRRIERAARR